MYSLYDQQMRHLQKNYIVVTLVFSSLVSFFNLLFPKYEEKYQQHFHCLL